MTQQDPGLPGGQPDVEPPVAELPLGQPGIYVPVAETPAAAPRRSVVLPAVLAVGMVLAAGVFLALWLTERGDHRTTTGQVSDVRSEIADIERRTSSALTEYSGKEKSLKEAEIRLAPKKAEADKYKPCVDAVKELRAAVDARGVDAATFLIMERCK